MQWWIGAAHTMAIFYEMICDSATIPFVLFHDCLFILNFVHFVEISHYYYYITRLEIEVLVFYYSD